MHLRKKSERRDIKLVDDFEIAFEVNPTTSLSYTKDLDLFIAKTLPPLPSGRRIDKGSVGVTSWLSPRTKDLVDLLTLVKVLGLPKGLPPLNQTQKENLALLEIAAKNF